MIVDRTQASVSAHTHCITLSGSFVSMRSNAAMHDGVTSLQRAADKAKRVEHLGQMGMRRILQRDLTRGWVAWSRARAVDHVGWTA